MENTPSLVCLTCLDTDSKMYSMSEHKLEQAYEHLTGYPLSEIINIEHTLCLKCTERLKNFEQFRDNSLKSRALMMELVKQHQEITTVHISALLARDSTPYTPCKQHVACGRFDAATESEGSALSHLLNGSATTEVFVKTEPSLDIASDSSEVKCEGRVDSLGEAPCTSEPTGFATSNETNIQQIKTEQMETTDKCEQVIDIKIELSSFNSKDSRHKKCTDTPNNICFDMTDDARRKLHKLIPEPSELLIIRQSTKSKVKAKSKKSFDCRRCPFKCSKKSILTQHRKSHSVEQIFTCDYCQYTTIRRGALVKHLRTHTGEKPFSCQFCSYKCSRQCNLVRHMRIHTGEKPYSCKVCPYRCADQSHLVSHMRRHTGEKPFSCKFCPNRYSEKSHLAEHLRSHTGERPFNCQLCSYSCCRKSNLVRHMRTHTGEKPYVCMVCPYASADRSTLVAHMKKHT